jgi:hypothetical protein
MASMHGSVADAPAPWRLATLVLPAVTCLSLAVAVGLPVSDWPIAVEAGDYLLDGHLDVYAKHPGAQMGPLALVLAALLPGLLYSGVVGALLPVFILLVLDTRRTQQVGPATFVAASLLAWPWATFAVQGHGDDALVLVGLAVVLMSHGPKRHLGVVGGFLLAIAAKPTAVLFLPLLLLSSRRTFWAGVGGAGLIWAPFVLADPVGFLAAGHGFSDVVPGSLAALIGIEPMSGYPEWVRPLQLAGGVLACWWLASRCGWQAAALGVVAWRTLLEPAPWNYYSASLIAVAAVFDHARASRVPVASLLAFATFAMYYVADPMPTAVGLLRLLALAALLFLAASSSGTGNGENSVSEELTGSSPTASPRDPLGVS